jgi:[ribosomal protein S5]-alanine N-acetyltransferase
MIGPGNFTRAQPVRLTTARFLLRNLLPGDASDRYLSWAADSEVMSPLNVSAVRMTRQQLAGYIGGFDGITRFLIGIFLREDERHIGFYMIETDPGHGLANFNVVIGDKEFWGKKVVLETRPVLLDHFFTQRGIEKALGSPLARNIPAIFNYKAEGWRLEGVLKSQRKSIKDGSRLDQMQFAMLKTEWLARKARA